jgi:flavorubredoxin
MTAIEDQIEARPYLVGEETYVIPWYLQAPPVGQFCMNSLVIRGREPVIVDTGSPANRVAWLDAVFSLVEPEDVRWVFLSHDDRDHAGNLLAVLDACPNATLLTTWFSIGRMAEEWITPLDRCRFLNDGDRVDAGDRTLTAFTPPLFDNPTTRGLFDSRTGVLWGVDTFAMPVASPMEDAYEVDDDLFADGILFGAQLVAPWHRWLDERKYLTHLDAIASLPIKTVASCHGPAMHGKRIDTAIDVLRHITTAGPWAPYSQSDLEMWLSSMHAGDASGQT